MAPHVDVPELPAWNTRDIEELSGNALLWSTVVESHAKKHNTKRDKLCVFCGKTYGGGPKDIEIHLDSGPKGVKTCQPKAEWVARHGAVLKELRACRDVQKKKAAFEAEKLSANIEAKKAAAEHGLAPGQTTLENSLTGNKITPEDVHMQWMQAMAKKGLAPDFPDDREVRRLARIASSHAIVCAGAKGYPHDSEVGRRLPRRKGAAQGDEAPKAQALHDQASARNCLRRSTLRRESSSTRVAASTASLFNRMGGRASKLVPSSTRSRHHPTEGITWKRWIQQARRSPCSSSPTLSPSTSKARSLSRCCSVHGWDV